jgi:VWFA-related protein
MRRNVGGPAGSDETAKRCTEMIRRERLRTQARQGAATNKTVGPTFKNMKRIRLAVAGLLLSMLVLAAYSAPRGGKELQKADDTLRVSVDLVNVQFSVTDRRGRFVPGLTAQDFKVEEDGRRQEIRNFARENELPLTLAMLIDTSPSVRPVFDEEKLTAVGFLESILHDKDLALIMGFDREVTLVQDYTDNVRSLKRAIDDLDIGGGTSVYDAVYLASTEKLSDEAGRKAIILISDGEDTTSKLKFNEALIAAHRSNAVVYCISNAARGGFFTYGRGPSFGGGDLGTLKKFSDETGGTTFVVNNENNFKKIFDQIAQELRSQYSLGYFSLNTARDGKYRQLKITARDSSYNVKSRKGYYAPRS